MKKIFISLFLLIIGLSTAAKDVDYEQIYRDLPVPTHSYVHGIDPGEGFDMRNTTWSPYPLLRLTSPLFFKTITIREGYYLLTPREHEGKWYMLFKEQGKIKYIIPIYERDLTPMNFYNENLPKPKLTFTQKVHIKTLDVVGKVFPSAKREPQKQTYLEMYDLDNNFISLVVYWGAHRYYMILRSISL